MSFPKITNECIMAVLEKATQRDPYTYAAESLMNLIRDEQIVDKWQERAARIGRKALQHNNLRRKSFFVFLRFLLDSA